MGSDGAAVMVGKRNGVAARLREQVRTLFLLENACYWIDLYLQFWVHRPVVRTKIAA